MERFGKVSSNICNLDPVVAMHHLVTVQMEEYSKHKN